jgi:hypothetical protein
MNAAIFRLKIKELFGVDLRSLALFRIGLALTMLLDLWMRAQDITAFYSDSGLLPRAVLLKEMPNVSAISVHFISGLASVETLLFVVQALCGLGLLMGWRTRMMTLLCWFFTISLHWRNPVVLNGGNEYMRALLFWSIFLPLGARYSLDSSLSRGAKQSTQFLSWGTVAVLMQTAILYWVTVAYKWRCPVWHDGNAIYYALNIDLIAKTGARFLLLFQDQLKFLTAFVVWFEILGPFLLFFPFRTGIVRTFTTLLFIAMHCGFLFCLAICPFPQISVTAMFVFLPAWFWDRMAPGFDKKLHLAFEWCRRNSKAWNFPTLVRPRETRPQAACVLFFLFCVVWWNLAALSPVPCRMPPSMVSICYAVHLDQSWMMFADPGKQSGWFVIPGRLQDGEQIDLLKDGAPLTWAPSPGPIEFKSEAWRAYMTHINFGWNKILWPQYAEYLHHSWDSTHNGAQWLQSLQIVLIAKVTPPPGQVAPVYHKIVLLQQNYPNVWPGVRTEINPSFPTKPGSERVSRQWQP